MYNFSLVNIFTNWLKNNFKIRGDIYSLSLPISPRFPKVLAPQFGRLSDQLGSVSSDFIFPSVPRSNQNRKNRQQMNSLAPAQMLLIVVAVVVGKVSPTPVGFGKCHHRHIYCIHRHAANLAPSLYPNPFVAWCQRVCLVPRVLPVERFNRHVSLRVK